MGGKYIDSLPGQEHHSVRTNSELDRSEAILTQEEIRDSQAKVQAQSQQEVTSLKEAANEEQADGKIGNPERFLDIALTIRKSNSPEKMQALASEYQDIMAHILDNGDRSAFSLVQQVEIEAILAVTDTQKTNIISKLINEGESISGLSKEEAGRLVDSVINAENYANIKAIYEETNPGKSFPVALAAAYDKVASKLIEEVASLREVEEDTHPDESKLDYYRNLEQQNEALRRENEELRLRRRSSEPNYDEAFSEDNETEPSSTVNRPRRSQAGASALTVAEDFDFESNIKHPGLSKFISKMNAYRVSDQERFTTIMRSKTFDEAQQKYDLMISEIEESTKRNAVNSGSAKIEQRLDRLYAILERRQEQLKAYIEPESNSGSGSSGYSNSQNNNSADRARNRLIRGVNFTQALITRLETKYDAALSREAENGPTAALAYQIQGQIFERFENNGYFDRAHMPNPGTDLAEQAEYLANPSTYERHYLPPEERKRLRDERTREREQLMAEEARLRQEEADRIADRSYIINSEVLARDPTAAYAQMSPSVLRRGMHREMRGELNGRVRSRREQLLELADHMTVPANEAPQTYFVSSDYAKNLTPGQLDFIARGGGPEARAVLSARAQDKDMTIEEFGRLQRLLDPEAANKAEETAEQRMAETTAAEINPELQRQQNIIKIAWEYLDAGNKEYFKSFYERVSKDPTLNEETRNKLNEFNERYILHPRSNEREERNQPHRIEYNKIATTLFNEYKSLDGAQLQLLSEKIVSLSPMEKAQLNMQFVIARRNIEEGRVKMSERGTLAFKRFERDLNANFDDGSIAA